MTLKKYKNTSSKTEPHQTKQPHKPPPGHSENIDGCGLTLETRLRKQFYALIKLLIKFCANSIDDDEDEDEGCKDDGDDKLNVFKKQYKSLITVVTLHFLDTRWQACIISVIGFSFLFMLFSLFLLLC